MLNDTSKTYAGQTGESSTIASQTLKLGTHRGNRRIWLDHSDYLSAAEFLPGATYTADYLPGVNISRTAGSINATSNGLIILRLHPDGKTKVSKKTKGGKLHPVIDMNSKKIGEVFPAAENITVTYQNNQIIIEAAQ